MIDDSTQGRYVNDDQAVSIIEASCIRTQRPPWSYGQDTSIWGDEMKKIFLTGTYIVRWFLILTFSLLFLEPSSLAQLAGGIPSSSCASCAISKLSNACRRRTSINEASLYANCCPRQIRGPALKGRNMNGLGVRYLWRRLSRNLSGSNSWAE